MITVWNYLRRDLWSPYLAGALLGIVSILSLWVTNHYTEQKHMPGASGGFQNLASYVGQELTSEEKTLIEGQKPITVAKKGMKDEFMYFGLTVPKGVTWQVWLLIGLFFGAMVSSLLSRGFRISLMPHTEQWQAIWGPQIWKRWLLVFVGAMIIEIAAAIAGGCTSGLAISGGVQLTPAAFLFIPSMFVSGTLTALLVYRRRF